MKDKKLQEKLLADLRSGKLEYGEASIYTILYDLVKGNGIDEVVAMLHNLCNDLGKRKELESEFEKLKNTHWD